MKQVDFEIVGGDSRTLTVHVTNADGTDTNLDDASIIWTARRSIALLEDEVITKTTDDPTDVLIEVPAGGIFSVNIKPLDTSTIPSGIYDHEARVTESDGTITTVFRGSMTVIQSLSDVSDPEAG